jgi:putative tricarboxylic transport membrane protein
MAPLALSLMLEPVTKQSFHQALIAAQGDVTTFNTRPLSGIFIALASIFFLLPLASKLRKHRQAVHSG